ncbi:MAG: hypothetical protein V3W34_08295 [Phycisphaerae bacterium]
MTIDQLRKVHQATPFRPFTLQIADGNEVHVPHPEFLWFPPQGSRTIFVATPGQEGVKIIDLLLVASIELGDGKP